MVLFDHDYMAFVYTIYIRVPHPMNQPAPVRNAKPTKTHHKTARTNSKSQFPIS